MLVSAEPLKNAVRAGTTVCWHSTWFDSAWSFNPHFAGLAQIPFGEFVRGSAAEVLRPRRKAARGGMVCRGMLLFFPCYSVVNVVDAVIRQNEGAVAVF
jgi:hypothetical protein